MGKINLTKEQIEEIKTICSDGAIVLGHLGKKYTMDQKTLKKLLIENNIKFETKYGVPKNIAKKICKEYLMGASFETIAKKYNKTVKSIYKFLRRNNIEIRSAKKNSLVYSIKNNIEYKYMDPDVNKSIKECVKFFQSNNIEYKLIVSKKNDWVIIKTVCSVCGEKCNKYSKQLIKQLEKYDNKILCRKCMDHNARHKIKSTNTSGYIGVSIFNNRKKEPSGYCATIIYKKKRILRKHFCDLELKESTLIEAAVCRDVYIILNDLPHTRNFIDDELLSEMLKYFTKEERDEVIEKLKETNC